jgi:hypothetical protein
MRVRSVRVGHDSRESRYPVHRAMDHALAIRRNEFNHVMLECRSTENCQYIRIIRALGFTNDHVYAETPDWLVSWWSRVEVVPALFQPLPDGEPKGAQRGHSDSRRSKGSFRFMEDDQGFYVVLSSRSSPRRDLKLCFSQALRRGTGLLSPRPSGGREGWNKTTQSLQSPSRNRNVPFIPYSPRLIRGEPLTLAIATAPR